jgi:hypothetical protein
MNPQYLEFTRSGYRNLLKQAISAYRFVPLADYKAEKGVCIWRHDVDMSPQAARALGKIEQREGVRAVYYFNLRSPFYNLLEPACLSVVNDLLEMGHDIGLHFDASILTTSSVVALEQALSKERVVFESLVGCEIKSFSFHNPGAHTQGFKDESYAGLINAYSSVFAENCSYCSDSNGYWRFTPLGDFLAMGHPSVYVLTHADWWTPRIMAPRQRVLRAVRGRAHSIIASYDLSLAIAGRPNLR